MHKYITRNPHVRVRKGGGPGCPALLNYELLRADIKQRIFEKYGDVKEHNKRNKLTDLITTDFQASTYFANYQFDDETGIRPERQAEYNANAMVLNAIIRFVNDTSSRQKALGNKTTKIWQVVSEAVNTIDRTAYPHTLPSNAIRLKEKYKNYLDHGYFQLIHKGTGNDNARRVNDRVEQLIISIYCMENLPFGSWVHDNYLQFIAGSKLIVDRTSGEMFDRDDFFDEKRGSYITISRGTVWNIIHNPANANIIDRLRNNRIDHLTLMTPHVHRKSPTYSLSKISMDDRTLSRKTTDGKWLNLYVAYDVMSGAILSTVYSTGSPDVKMVMDCFRELYRTINTHNLVWPGEVEVENHLMRGIEPELKAMFAFVTFGIPGSSRQKRAEHLHRAKKYGDEKSHQVGIGRWYGKGPYKVKSNNKDEEYKQPRLPLEQLIQEDRESVERFNNELHPKQKLFPGKTRWQVLVENQNPDLGPVQKFKLFRYMGIRCETSIRNNDYCQVMNAKYSIDQQGSIARLKPNNYQVEAYCIPDPDGNVGECFLYQGDTFITRATRIERYNEARIERTDKDEEIRTAQSKRQAHFFKVEKEGIEEKVTRKLEIISPEQVDIKDEVVIVPEPVAEEEESLDDLIQHYSSEHMKDRAINEI